MLRIEEIVGAMDDEFRYALDAMSDDQLAALAADRAALRRLRPVGVSTAEALAMIQAIQQRRAATLAAAPAKARSRKPRSAKPKPDPAPPAEAPAPPPAAPAKPARKRTRKPKAAAPPEPREPALPLIEIDGAPAAPLAPEPASPAPPVTQTPPAPRPLRRLPQPEAHDRLAPPAAGRPAIRLGPPPGDTPAISLPPPAAAPTPPTIVLAHEPQDDSEEAVPGRLNRLPGVIAVLVLVAILAATLTWL